MITPVFSTCKKYLLTCNIIILLLLSMVLAGCNKDVKEESVNNPKNEGKNHCEQTTLFAMDTYMSLSVYGEEDVAKRAVLKCKNEIERLDATLSTERDDNEFGLLNSAGIYGLTEERYDLFKMAMDYADKTGGLFNPMIRPIVSAWGFNSKNYRVPDDKEIKELLKLTNLDDVEYTEVGNVNFKKEGMSIDLGGITKGYASSKLINLLKDSGITSAMVDLGGNIQVLGMKPDNTKWSVAIKNPASEENYLGVLSLSDKAVVTSGNYERFFEENGKKYHHIIDPATGYPAESGLVSVTVICDDGVMADAMSTALFVAGKDKAINYWKNHSDEFDLVLYTEDGKIYVTENIKDIFSSELEFEIVSLVE